MAGKKSFTAQQNPALAFISAQEPDSGAEDTYLQPIGQTIAPPSPDSSFLPMVQGAATNRLSGLSDLYRALRSL